MKDWEMLMKIQPIIEACASLGYECTFDRENNSIIVHLKDEELLSLMKYFEDYIKEIPDFMFGDACREFTKITGVSIKDFDMILKEGKDKAKIEDLIASFKDATVHVANKFLEELNKKYM